MRQLVQKFQWRQLFFFIAIVLLGLLIIRNIGRFELFLNLLKSVNLVILAPIVLIRYLSYRSNTLFFVHYFRIFKKKIAYQEIFSRVVAMNFVNTVFPLGSISGTTFLVRELDKKVEGKTVIVGQVAYQSLSAIAYLSFMLIAFILLVFSNSIGQGGFRLIILLIFGLIVAGVVLLLLILNRSIAEFIILTSTRPLNSILGWFGQSALSRKNLIELIDQFYETGGYFVKNYRKLKKPFWYAWQGVFWEAATVYIVALAFHQLVNPGVIIAAYILALIFSLASIFTAGVGVYEATMVTVLVALGMAFTTAVSIVIVYRVIAMWLFLPIGLIFYRRSTVGAKRGA